MNFNTMIDILEDLAIYSRDMKKDHSKSIDFDCWTMYSNDELATKQAIHILKLSTAMLKSLFENFDGQDITAEMVKHLLNDGFSEIDFKMLNIDIDINELDFDF